MFKTSFLALAAASLCAPAWAASYKIDAVHSTVGFKIRHMMVAKASGRFSKFAGGFDFDAKKSELCGAKADIETESVDTANEKRDGHLRGPDFFEVAKYPLMQFRADGCAKFKGGKAKVKGTLTLHGVSKPVTLEAEFHGVSGSKAGFSARTRINRKDFSITWNRTLDNGGVALADEVDIELEIEADEVK